MRASAASPFSIPAYLLLIIVLCCCCHTVRSGGSPLFKANSPYGRTFISTNVTNFVEDKTVIFECTLSLPDDGMTAWFLKDRRTRRRFHWITSSGSTTLFRKVSSSTMKASVSIVMSRYLENKDLVCFGERTEEATFTIPSVKKTIPVDAINFKTKDFELGAQIQHRCYVRAALGVVKRVFIRHDLRLDHSTNQSRISDNWTLYEFATVRKAEMIDDGSPMQCIAETANTKSDYGNVLSEETLMVVHHFKFTSSCGPNTPILEGSPVRLSFNVTANPRPRVKQFFLAHALMPGLNRTIDSNLTVRIVDKQNFIIVAEFVPKEAGMYKVSFQSSILRRTSGLFLIQFKGQVERPQLEEIIIVASSFGTVLTLCLVIFLILATIRRFVHMKSAHGTTAWMKMAQY